MADPIRLLRIACVGNDRLGGMTRTMYATGDHLAEMGFEVDYVFAEKFPRSIPHSWRRFTGPWEVPAIISKLRDEGKIYDIVEVHEPLALGPGMQLLTSRWHRHKLVAFSYGLEERNWPLARQYQRQHHVPMLLKSRLTGWVQSKQSALGLRQCHLVVCSNQQDADYLADRGFTSDRLAVHHSGVEESMLAAGAQHQAHRPHLLFLGSWIERKGILNLVPAVVSILRNHPHLHFTVAGCQVDSSVVLANFPEDVRPNVRVIPKVTSEAELHALYLSHGIFILPSYFEGQPLVMLEAAAFAMAIVTTPVCGMLDFIRHEENGLFSPVGDASALTHSIDQLLSQPDLAIRLGNAARADAERHTWKASAENLSSVYRSLAGQE